MKRIFFCALFLALKLPQAMAGISCELKFDTLEELRISSFDSAASALTRKDCYKVAEDFLMKAGAAPYGCVKAKALVRDWSDSYHSDTKKNLPANPTQAYLTIKQWAYQTLKMKCTKRQFN